MRRPLRIVYPDREVLRRALEGDLARGGAFVPCDDPPPLQERVVVAVELPFARQRILLDADVVHRVDAGAGGTPEGVGVQFLEPAELLAARFEPFVRESAAPPPDSRAVSHASDGDGLFESDDLFDDPASSGAENAQAGSDVDGLSDDELEAILDSGVIEEAIEDALAPAEAEEAKEDPFGWFDPGARSLAPEAEAPRAPGPAPGDPSFDPSEIDLEAGDEPIPELGTPGTGHRTRADD